VPTGTAVPQGQGHTIWSRHIEEPRQRFAVDFDSMGYVKLLRFPRFPNRSQVVQKSG